MVTDPQKTVFLASEIMDTYSLHRKNGVFRDHVFTWLPRNQLFNVIFWLNVKIAEIDFAIDSVNISNITDQHHKILLKSWFWLERLWTSTLVVKKNSSSQLFFSSCEEQHFLNFRREKWQFSRKWQIDWHLRDSKNQLFHVENWGNAVFHRS